MTGASGYAVADVNGDILIKTVGPTAQSAMVNWLWAYAGVPVTNAWSLGDITSCFNEKSTALGSKLVPVTVTADDAPRR